MVNSQTVNDARMNQFKDQSVCITKYRRVFNPHAHQAGDFKETPPRELFRGFTPGHQPPALGLVQRRNAFTLHKGPGVKRIGGVVVDQRGFVRDRVTFYSDGTFLKLRLKGVARNGSCKRP